MKKVIILGAGASKSYEESKTGVKMPIANDFFETFRKLDIAENPWVLIGELLHYVAERNNGGILDFLDFNGDIEELHTEIQEKLYHKLKQKNFQIGQDNVTLIKSYNQLIFLFISVINEIQNGPISDAHIRLAKQLSNEDSIITFNWDTLMDRALKNATGWNTDFGYFVSPVATFRNGWEKLDDSKKKLDFPILLKLHGSSNWLTSHNLPENGKMELMQDIDADKFFIYESTINPYDCFAGRFMDGYEEFSYGYYPPNLPIKGKSAPDGMMIMSMRIKNPLVPEGTSNSSGLTSMPLIIPPVKHKEYDSFGDLFLDLWTEARDRLVDADKIYIIGYSFPVTDIRSNDLFKSVFKKRKDYPEIIILNPNPDCILDRFHNQFGVPKSKIKIIKDYFTEDFIL
ncbi:hypothetical protein [Flavobacterium sp.]|uniref:hypothetical protein n=1 Tax=Flavobacterium sp. TaxID=239 RepID=UPI002FDB2491